MPATDVEQENIALVRRGFTAFQNHDMQTLAELFDAAATWRTAPTGVLGGDRQGRDDIFRMFGQLSSETQGTFRVEPTTFAAAEDHVYVSTRSTGSRNGKTLTQDEVLVFTVAGGKVRDVQFFAHDYPANAAFWA